MTWQCKQQSLVPFPIPSSVNTMHLLSPQFGLYHYQQQCHICYNSVHISQSFRMPKTFSHSEVCLWTPYSYIRKHLTFLNPLNAKSYTECWVTDTYKKYFNIHKSENIEIQSKWFYNCLGIAEQEYMCTLEAVTPTIYQTRPLCFVYKYISRNAHTMERLTNTAVVAAHTFHRASQFNVQNGHKNKPRAITKLYLLSYTTRQLSAQWNHRQINLCTIWDYRACWLGDTQGIDSQYGVLKSVSKD